MPWGPELKHSLDDNALFEVLKTRFQCKWYLLVDLTWSSIAALAIAPLQDLLNLGAESRMNIPGRATGNWRWRVPDNIAEVQHFDGCAT